MFLDKAKFYSITPLYKQMSINGKHKPKEEINTGVWRGWLRRTTIVVSNFPILSSRYVIEQKSGCKNLVV